jgi:hypothetical protein
MKDLTKALSSSHPGALPFALAQSTTNPRHTHTKLTGLAKVLAGGRVVNMRKEKPFADRMLSDGLSNYRPTDASICLEHVILESVATNLEAGVKLLDKQEFTLAKMGGRLSEMALSLNLARQKLEPVDIAQKSFEQSLEKFRVLTKETFDHTALFSTGPAKPVTVAVPARTHWEGLSIDRCNLSSPGFRAVDIGKVSPDAEGLLLDPESFSIAFQEWRIMCAVNRMQWHLIYSRWRSIVSTLKYLLGGRRWTPPPFPDDCLEGPLKRPHLDN